MVLSLFFPSPRSAPPPPPPSSPHVEIRNTLFFGLFQHGSRKVLFFFPFPFFMPGLPNTSFSLTPSFFSLYRGRQRFCFFHSLGPLSTGARHVFPCKGTHLPSPFLRPPGTENSRTLLFSFLFRARNCLIEYTSFFIHSDGRELSSIGEVLES